MAQANYTPIQLYYSATLGAVPLAANLADGELAINVADGKLYYKTSGGVVAIISSAANVSSFSAGTTGFTPSTATSGAVTLAGTLNVASGGTNLTSYTAGDILYATGATTLAKLGIGTAGQILQVSGGLPAWGAASTGVTTFSAGTTGLTPSTATSGAVTLAGTLNAVSGGTGQTVYAVGDIIYANSTTTLAKLPVSTNGFNLTLVGGLPAWSAPSTGVSSFTTSLDGLTPNVATTGAVTLAGTLGSSSGGTGFTTYAAGDMIYASATNTLAKLTAGTNGQYLVLTGGVPAWTTVAAGGVTSFSAGTTGLTPSTASTGIVTLAGTLATANGGTNITAYTTGDLLYASASNTLSRLPAGTNGHVLTLVGGVPAWQASTGGVTSFQTSLSGLTPSTATTGVVTLAGTLGITSGGTNLTSYTVGDLIYASATNTLANLGIGSNGQVLTVVAGNVGWASSGSSGVASISFSTSGLTPSTPSTGSIVLGGALNTTFGGTGITGYTAGDTLYYVSGNALSKLALGAANALYVVNSGGTAPTYASLSTVLNTISSTQGTILYRSTGSWLALSPGTSGQFLKTQGSGADPVWDTVAASGGVTSITFGSTGLTPSTATTGAVTVGGTLIVGNGGTGINSYAIGDIPYANATTTLTRLTIGTASQIMTVNGTATAPQWVSSLNTGQGGTGLTTYTAGDTLYYGAGTTFSKLAIGATSTIMLSNGTSPTWSTVTAVLDTIGSTQGQILYRGAASWAVLPTGTSGNVLTTGGVGANPSWVAPVSGLNGLTSTLNVAAPNATNNVSTLTASGGTTNQFLAIAPKGTGGLLAAIPDSTAVGGNVRGTNSVDWQTTRTAAGQVASGASSVIAGGANNIADGSLSAIVGGSTNQATGPNSFVGGGFTNTISAAGQYGGILNGNNNAITGLSSSILGGGYSTDRGITHARVFGSNNMNQTASTGLQQAIDLQVGFETSTATLQILNSQSTGAASATNQMVLANNTAYAFQIICIAGVTTAGASKAWRITGAIKRGASAASTILVGTPSVDILAADAAASAWLLNVVADTTNGALQVQATGAAATTIRWNAKIQSVQIGF